MNRQELAQEIAQLSPAQRQHLRQAIGHTLATGNELVAKALRNLLPFDHFGSGS